MAKHWANGHFGHFGRGGVEQVEVEDHCERSGRIFFELF